MPRGAPQRARADAHGLGKKAREGTLSIDEMAGGTFTISNGGVYGSLLSTPIINPPQSAILGMHSINPRAAVRARARGPWPDLQQRHVAHLPDRRRAGVLDPVVGGVSAREQQGRPQARARARPAMLHGEGAWVLMCVGQ